MELLGEQLVETIKESGKLSAVEEITRHPDYIYRLIPPHFIKAAYYQAKLNLFRKDIPTHWSQGIITILERHPKYQASLLIPDPVEPVTAVRGGTVTMERAVGQQSRRGTQNNRSASSANQPNTGTPGPWEVLHSMEVLVPPKNNPAKAPY